MTIRNRDAPPLSDVKKSDIRHRMESSLTTKNAKNTKKNSLFGLQSVGIAHFREDLRADGHAIAKRKGAKAQRGKPQPNNMNRSKQRKQSVEYFAQNAEFS
jgi:hypothetical protein